MSVSFTGELHENRVCWLIYFTVPSTWWIHAEQTNPYENQMVISASSGCALHNVVQGMWMCVAKTPGWESSLLTQRRVGGWSTSWGHREAAQLTDVDSGGRCARASLGTWATSLVVWKSMNFGMTDVICYILASSYLLLSASSFGKWRQYHLPLWTVVKTKRSISSAFPASGVRKVLRKWKPPCLVLRSLPHLWNLQATRFLITPSLPKNWPKFLSSWEFPTGSWLKGYMDWGQKCFSNNNKKVLLKISTFGNMSVWPMRFVNLRWLDIKRSNFENKNS